MKRNTFLDAYRGFSLVSMLFFHGYYDLIYIFDYPMPQLSAAFVHGWQQSILLSFIFIAGASTIYSRHLVKRGLVLTLLGFGITMFTLFFMPAELIIFGVLNFMGAAFLLLAPFQKGISALPKGSKWLLVGLLVAAGCLGYTRGLSANPVIVYSSKFGEIPLSFSALAIFALGLPTIGISSADYVPILPNIFVFLAGRFFWQYIGGLDVSWKENIFTKLGRHSLAFYLLHQPVLYGVLGVYMYMRTF